MENKVRFDGTILNEPKLTDFGTTLMRVQNKQEFKKRDGTQGSSSCTMVVSVGGTLAAEVVNRFKRGNVVRVEGALTLKKTKQVDAEGKEIWEVWIRARTVNALPDMESARMEDIVPKKPLQERMGYHPLSTATTKILPQQHSVPVNMFDPEAHEEVLNDLPF